LVGRDFVRAGRLYVVRFMRYGNGFPALEYLLDQNDDIRATFFAYASHFADFGPLPGESRGRWLRANYKGIYEFKPQQHRLFAFLHEYRLFLTNGAPKRSAKEQRNDYDVATTMRANFFEGIEERKKRQSFIAR
jgi:hypothetical protein